MCVNEVSACSYIRYFQTVKFHPSLETSASSHRRFEAVFWQIFSLRRSCKKERVATWPSINLLQWENQMICETPKTLKFDNETPGDAYRKKRQKIEDVKGKGRHESGVLERPDPGTVRTALWLQNEHKIIIYRLIFCLRMKHHKLFYCSCFL